MQNKNRIVLIGAAVLVVLLVLWFLGGWYAKNQAEKKLSAFIEENNLSQVLYWKQLSATPFGKVTLSDVSYVGNEPLSAKKVVINRFQDDDDGLALDVKIESLANLSGNAPNVAVEIVGYATGKPNLPPMNIALVADINYKKDKALFDLQLDLPEVGVVDGKLELKETRGVQALRQQINAMQAGMSTPGFGGLSELAMLGSIQPVSLEVTVNDNGGMARFVELRKRYLTTPTPGQNTDKEMEKQYEKELEEAQQACLTKATNYVKNAKSACGNITKFLAADKSKLVIKAEAKRPFAVGTIVEQLMFGSVNDVLARHVEMEIK